MIRVTIVGVLVAAAILSTTAAPTHADVTMGAHFVGDSVRVVAAWSPRCDAKGCPESYRVTWTRAGVGVVTRTIKNSADTVYVIPPAYGDTVRVAVSVVALRRTLPSAAVTGTMLVKYPDAPPLPVDSLKVDTLAAFAAGLDSFPVIDLRDSLGVALPSNVAMLAGDTLTVCELARNRYTGRVLIMVPPNATDAEEAALAAACEVARTRYALEKGS